MRFQKRLFFLLFALALCGIAVAQIQFTLYPNPDDTTLSGTDPVFGTAWHNAWKVKDLSINFETGEIKGTLFEGSGGTATMTGKLNPETYFLTAKIVGSENYQWPPDALRKSTFEGTFEGSLDTYRQEILKTFDSPIPKEQMFYWEGTLKVRFSTFKFSSGSIQGGNFNIRGDAAAGQEYSGKSMLKVRGNLSGTSKHAKSADTSPAQSLEVKKITVKNLNGDLEYRRGKDGPFLPLTKDVVLGPGDFVATGVDSRVTLDLGFGELHITPLTQIRIDEYVLDPSKLAKTQMYLYVGAISAKVKHTPSIRSDFSVRTPTALSSIRGSAMTVIYDENANQTTLVVNEDEAFIQGAIETQERVVKEGYTSSVSSDGVAKAPREASEEELAMGEVPSSKLPWIVGTIVGLLTMVIAIKVRKSK